MAVLPAMRQLSQAGNMLINPLKTKKMKPRNLSKQLIIWIMPLICSLLIYACTKDGCKLTDNDMDWLLEEYDSLYYLKNGTDTIAVPVETAFGQDEYDWQWGIRAGDNDYYGYSKIKIRVTNDSLTFRTWINACEPKLNIVILENKANSKKTSVYRYYLSMDSATNNNQIINGVAYNNCFNFFNTNDSILHDFVFAKNHGVIKFLTNQNDLFELLPTE
jgi:hypothetical protein